MPLWWTHICLLLWKDVFTYQFRRHTFVTMLELLLPAFITYVYIYITSLASTSAARKDSRMDTDVFVWAASYLGAVSLESDNLISMEGDDAYDIEQPSEAFGVESLVAWRRRGAERASPRRCVPEDHVSHISLRSQHVHDPAFPGEEDRLGAVLGLKGEHALIPTTQSLLPRSSILLLILGVGLHCASSPSFPLVVATLVPRPAVGLVTMSFVVFGSLVAPFGLASFVPATLVRGSTLDRFMTLCLLLPNVAFNYFLINASDLDYHGGPGAQFFNVGRVGLHGTSVYRAVHAMCGSCLLSVVLCWYLSRVWPHSYSFPEKFYFFLQPSYWGIWRSVDLPGEGLGDIKENATLFEPSREQKQAHLVIYKLSKVTDPLYLKHYIINNVTIKCFIDSITVILGRNGCGKIGAHPHAGR
ncbi:hypothetical protein MRX96_003645 [Rhipicephalus microplus]